jgi:DNA (cytosine-5)-methyltransferase 1
MADATVLKTVEGNLVRVRLPSLAPAVLRYLTKEQHVLTYGSVCSGIEAATVAWGMLGWAPQWYCEIDQFPSAVLKHHYPDVVNYGDMLGLEDLIKSKVAESPDILCGGTPCQAFSTVGNRESLTDSRANLTLKFCEVADAIDEIRGSNGQQPAIVFWENVPGVLNTPDNAFGCFVGELAGEQEPITLSNRRWADAGLVVGPKRTVVWRVLDAQHFGLAQRRRRLFVVASAREDIDIGQVLFEFKSSAGLRTESGEDSKTSAGLPLRGNEEDVSGRDAVAIAYKFRGKGRYTGEKGGERLSEKFGGGSGFLTSENKTFTLSTDQSQIIAVSDSLVRNLSATEYERLQGFPDNYTKIPYNGKPAEKCPDYLRFRALGNSWPVPVITWIGKRIENLLNK